MMRFQRVGRKNDPSFRIVVTDKRTGPKSSKHVDQVGSYHPKTKHTIIDGEKVKHWLAQGVQASPTVHNLLVTHKLVEGKKLNVLSKKSPIIDEEKLKAEAEAKAAAEAAAEPEPELPESASEEAEETASETDAKEEPVTT